MRNPLLVISGVARFFFFLAAKRVKCGKRGECVSAGSKVRGQLPPEFICHAHCGPH